jgi:hypothetical protein
VIQLSLPFTADKTHKEFCMKKLFLLLVPVLFLSACVSITEPVMLDKSFPSAEKYEILGEVGAGEVRFIILGLIWVGGVEWLDLLREAKEKYGDVDDVVSVSVDTEVTSILGIFTWQRITMRGIAILYTNTPVPETP